PTSLQKFFYSWFTETSSELEHLHLVLPPPCPADPALVIKCDLLERLLCPYQLPFSEIFSIHTESNICKHTYPPPSKTLGLKVAVQNLETFFIGQLHTNINSIPPRPTNPVQALSLREGSSLLLKSIIPQELLLPMSPVISQETAKPESVLRVKASLSEVKSLPDLNPLSLNCGLIPVLLETSLPRSAVDKARAVRQSTATGPAKMNKVPAGQQNIGSFFSPQPADPPARGGRLTANYWSNPLVNVNKTGLPSRPGKINLKI
ncbi:meiosis 1 arrest protein-like, partial [Elysia marginata]